MNGETDEDKSKSQSGDTAAQTNPEAPGTEPLVHRVKGKQGEEKPDDQTKYCAGNPPVRVSKKAEWTHAIISAVLVIITACILWIYSGQLEQMRKSVAQVASNERLEERAWIAPFKIVGTAQEGQPWTVSVFAGNTGRTFGKKYWMVALVRHKELADPEINYELEIQNFLNEATGSGVSNFGLFAPNQVFQADVKVFGGSRLTAENMESIKSPMIIWLVFGRITYIDIFGCEHWTKFCYRYFADGHNETYGSFNDADEGCH